MNGRAAVIIGNIDCVSLIAEFRAELVETWDVSESEAVRICALVREWHDEPNNRMTAKDRRADIRTRIVCALTEWRRVSCAGCRVSMDSPFMLDAGERPLCSACAGLVCGLGCGHLCPADDRNPYRNGTRDTVVHAECALRLSNALNLQLHGTMLIRMSPMTHREPIDIDRAISG